MATSYLLTSTLANKYNFPNPKHPRGVEKEVNLVDQTIATSLHTFDCHTFSQQLKDYPPQVELYWSYVPEHNLDYSKIGIISSDYQ